MEHLEAHWITHARAYVQYLVDQGITELLVPPPEEVPLRVEPAGLEEVRADLGDCTRCPLHTTRTCIVFGEGNPSADLMFIGEGPGAEEDRQGRPFVGKAGKLLDKMISAMGMKREDVYIANVVKCRPPENRDPLPEEQATCFPFLEAQIKAIGPRVIVALGRIATHTLLRTDAPLSRLRGHFYEWKGISVMPTYHPSFLLQKGGSGPYKAHAWSDLKQVMSRLGLGLPDSGGKS
ncbi:MAG: uracil-DNA glycosylase [Thermodesulfobacteriota bacterium]